MLPLAGGLFDQPAGYITRIETVLRASAEQETIPRDNKAAAEERLTKRMEAEHGIRRS